jgi:hypothetical protein
VIGQEIEIQLREGFLTDQSLGDRPSHPIVQALSKNTEGKGV